LSIEAVGLAPWGAADFKALPLTGAWRPIIGIEAEATISATDVGENGF